MKGIQKRNLVYEIIKELGVAYKGAGGATIEVNFISHNGTAPKIDIRRWYTNEKGEKCLGKGVSLKKDQFIKLRDIINSIPLDIYDMEWEKKD